MTGDLSDRLVPFKPFNLPCRRFYLLEILNLFSLDLIDPGTKIACTGQEANLVKMK